MQTRQGSNYAAYCKAQNQGKWYVRRSIKEYDITITRLAKTNLKYANGKLKTGTGIADLPNEDETLTQDGKETAQE